MERKKEKNKERKKEAGRKNKEIETNEGIKKKYKKVYKTFISTHPFEG